MIGGPHAQAGSPIADRALKSDAGPCERIHFAGSAQCQRFGLAWPCVSIGTSASVKARSSSRSSSPNGRIPYCAQQLGLCRWLPFSATSENGCITRSSQVFKVLVPLHCAPPRQLCIGTLAPLHRSTLAPAHFHRAPSQGQQRSVWRDPSNRYIGTNSTTHRP